MGTDIHPFIEYREVSYNRVDAVVQQMKHDGEDLTPITLYSNWRIGGCYVEPRELIPDIKGHLYKVDDHDTCWVKDASRSMFLDYRNYALFAWLTNAVRQDYLENFPLVTSPRGLPAGITTYVTEAYSNYFAHTTPLG